MINEPLRSKETLNELKCTHDARPACKVDVYRQSLSRFLQGHYLGSVSNADCQGNNIMISRISFSDDLNVDHPPENEYKVTIIEREKAGWYLCPRCLSSWEYSLALCAPGWGEDCGLFI